MITAFVNFLIRKGALDKEYQETSVYGLTLLVEKVVTYLLLSGLALFMGKLAEGLVFAVCFVCLRQATGGFHAKTFLGCLAGSAVSFFIAVEVLAAWLDRCPLAVAVLLVLSIFCVVVWAPVNHPNLLLTEIVADNGPSSKFGEGSIKLANKIGVTLYQNSSGKYIGTDADEERNIQYIIFKNSKKKTAGSYTKTYKEIKKRGKTYMKKFSKKNLLKKCKN